MKVYKLPQKRVYPSVNKCIYCFESNSSPLSDEHIIPLGLSGETVLPLATCEKCKKIINEEFEQEYLKKTVIDIRAHLKLNSRSKRRRGKKPPWDRDGKIAIFDSEGAFVKYQYINYSDFPFFVCTPNFAPPTYFTKVSSNNGICITGVSLYLSEKAKLFLEKTPVNGSKLLSTFNPSIICREIAKIAHGSAVALIGLDRFNPLLTELITGKTDDISTYIGGKIRHDNDKTDELHQISIEINDNLVTGHVRLFSSLGVDGYTAVIGTMK